MPKKFARLVGIDKDCVITQENHSVFLHCLQTGLLLALKEQGRLTESQYRHAQERLDHQFRVSASRRKGATL